MGRAGPRRVRSDSQEFKLRPAPWHLGFALLPSAVAGIVTSLFRMRACFGTVRRTVAEMNDRFHLATTAGAGAGSTFAPLMRSHSMIHNSPSSATKRKGFNTPTPMGRRSDDRLAAG